MHGSRTSSRWPTGPMEGVLHDVASVQTSRLAGQDAAEAQGGVLGWL